MSAEILFISDLHLDQHKPDISLHFLNFLKTRAASARVLYILGDLFEVWSGDDNPAHEFDEIFTSLKQFSKSAEIYFLHGNRDFLVGQQLAQKTGIHLIHAPRIIKLGSKQVALLHGDELCTDDQKYQTFRNMVRADKWQHDFLAKPLTERLAITSQLRAQSHLEMSEKTTAIMDVNQQAVVDTFNQLKVDTIIHGHTHRPAIHQINPHQQRIVLGDWNPEPSYLSWNNGEFTLVDPRT